MKKTLIILLSIGVGAIAWTSLYACGGGMMGGTSHQGTHQGTDMSGHQGSHGTIQQDGATGATHLGTSSMETSGAHVVNQETNEGVQSKQQANQQQQPHVRNQDQARALVQEYLPSAGDRHLMIKKISETTDYYEAEIVDHDGALVDKIRVDKQTGTLQSAYVSE